MANPSPVELMVVQDISRRRFKQVHGNGAEFETSLKRSDHVCPSPYSDAQRTLTVRHRPLLGKRSVWEDDVKPFQNSEYSESPTFPSVCKPTAYNISY